MPGKKEMTDLDTAPPPEKRPRKKNQETREKILDAAQQAFARYPYHSASVRIISKLGGVDHALINYHFGSKAALFKAVLRRMMDQRGELEKSWFASVKPMGATRGFSVFLDYILDDYRKRPGLFHIAALNFRQVNYDNPIPGYELLEEFIKSDVAHMKGSLDLAVPDHEAEMFIRSMSTLIIGFLGSAGSHAHMMGMEPDSMVYFNWVKETALYTLLPRFKLMVQQASASTVREV